MASTWRAVGALIENGKGELLVVLRQKDRPEPNVYGLIGGGIKFLETERNACVREIFEETGLKVDPSQLEFLKKYNKDWQSAGHDIIFYLFRYKVNGSSPHITLNFDEAVSYLWETPEELYKRSDLMKGLYIILKDVYKL